MKSNYQAFTLTESVDRIDEILTTSDAKFEELNSIPSRDRLTFTNGFYVQCSSLFIDIRGSSGLSSKYQRPSLARIYRSYLSEMVAVMNGNIQCREINIAGDCAWGVFDTPLKSNIDSVFSTAAKLNSMIKIINCRFRKKKGYDPIKVGIGLDYGRALMLKSGYKGSGINDVIWMGEVVNQASKLCSYGNKAISSPLVLSNVIYNNLNENNQKIVNKNYFYDCYEGNIVDVVMENWHKENCT